MKKFVLFLAGMLCFSCDSSDDNNVEAEPLMGPPNIELTRSALLNEINF